MESLEKTPPLPEQEKPVAEVVESAEVSKVPEIAIVEEIAAPEKTEVESVKPDEVELAPLTTVQPNENLPVTVLEPDAEEAEEDHYEASEDDPPHPSDLEDEEGPYEEEMIAEDNGSDSDVAVVLSSDDDDDDKQKSVKAYSRVVSESEPDEDDEEDYDDDDLMNSVILSSKDNENEDALRKRKRSSTSSEEFDEKSPNLVRLRKFKIRPHQASYRINVKKRCIKGLNANKKTALNDTSDEEEEDLDEEEEMGIDSSYDGRYHYEKSDTNSHSMPSSNLSTPNKCDSGGAVAVIDLDSSPEKVCRKASSFVSSDTTSSSLSATDSSPNKERHTTPHKEDPLEKAKDEIISRLLEKKEKESLKQIQPTKDNESVLPEQTHKPEQKTPICKEDILMDITIENDEEDGCGNTTLKPCEVKDDIELTIPVNKVAVGKVDDDVKNEEAKIVPKDTISDDVIKSDDAVKFVMKEPEKNVKEDEIIDKNSQNIDLTTANANAAINKNRTIKRRRSSASSQNGHADAHPNPITEDSKQNSDNIHPAKKLRAELDTIFPKHNSILTEYINKTPNETVESIQYHINTLATEIQTLNDMIKAVEMDWNNMIHLKKMKEEICIRLTRKKQTMQLESMKMGETASQMVLDDDEDEHSPTKDLSKLQNKLQNTQARAQQLSSTPIGGTPCINENNIDTLQSSLVSENISRVNLDKTPTSCQHSSTAANIIENRANMKSSDLAKEKESMQKVHRNILSRPNSESALAGGNSTDAMNLSANGPTPQQQQQQNILNNYLTAQQQLGEMLNGHHQATNGIGGQPIMVGRQGVFKDVKSIIADYRSQHPETVPKRGRRVKHSSGGLNLSDGSILGNALKGDGGSRPSSNDSSSHSLSNLNINSSAVGNSTFKDILVQFAKLSGQQNERIPTQKSASTSNLNTVGTTPYPEVTLHAVPASQLQISSGTADNSTGSLLHGILTKYSRTRDVPNMNKSVPTVPSPAAASSTNFNNNFPSTLARLLTAPERLNSQLSQAQAYQNSLSNSGLNLSKVVGGNSEITITPVMNSQQHLQQQHQQHQQSLLQQHLQPQQLKELLSKATAGGSNCDRIKTEHFMNMDDEADDSVDRLVIDEGDLTIDEQHLQNHQRMTSQAIDENDVPICQGCKKSEAQFVCAGCGNQWYCSRECQVAAWDDHSEICTATKQIRNKYNLLKTRDVIYNNYNNNINNRNQIHDSLELLNNDNPNNRKKYYIIRQKKHNNRNYF